MPGNHVFISHATADDDFVRDLRLALEELGHAVWVDSRKLRGGDDLNTEIETAIRDAHSFIAVLSTQTVNSPWVKREIDMALAVQAERGVDYRVLPLLLPGMKPAALGMWFSREPLAVPVELELGKLAEAMLAILTGLGMQLPEDWEPVVDATFQPVDELILELRDPGFSTRKGVRRAKATATLVYQPADPNQRAIASQRYTVSAPLGPIEMEEIRWYLEDYFLWPVGVFKQRAERTEADLPTWGRALYDAALDGEATREALGAWRAAANQRRFSVWVDSDPPLGAGKKRKADAAEAAGAWLSLPWELLHDDVGYLIHGARAVSVRRRLPNRKPQPVRLAEIPIRILLLSPRPEVDEEGNGSVGYIDHRASALPLVAAVENLGELAAVTVLTPPTLPALEAELQRAADADEAYEVVHFDGHGVYDQQVGLGALLFEHPGDGAKLGQRRMQLVHAQKMAAIMRDHGVPLVFLEACQTAQIETDPLASVAAKLLAEGVNAVAAMRASVLVETSRRFVEAFYAALAEGKAVGQAMVAGQRVLEADSERGVIMGAGALHLHDWFVPVLYQEERDPPLFNRLPSKAARRLQAKQRRLAVGDLPATPAHHFVGRSRELLRLERLLAQQPYAVLRGSGGAGKTTLAVELARWLARSGRYGRTAFASLEHIHDDRALLDALGRQLLPDGDKYSVAQFPDLDQALQPVARALRDHPTLIVIDNVETLIALYDDNPASTQSAIPNPQSLIFNLCAQLLDADPATRLIFTTREPLPAPFDDLQAMLTLGRLSKRDAVRLVEQVMARHNWTPPQHDDGRTAEEVEALVEAVHGHARALVLLAPAVAEHGVRAATGDLHTLMAELERKHPGQRENSLYASVELSLRRLPPEVREKIRVLAVFRDGAKLSTLAMMLIKEIEDEKQARQAVVAATVIAQQLLEVGLGEMMDCGYLRIDPALPSYLTGELTPAEIDTLRVRWSVAMMQLVGFLHEQHFKDTKFAARLTLLELPDLMVLLDRLSDYATPTQIVDTAGRIEFLLAQRGQSAALARAVAARMNAAEHLCEWNNAFFWNKRLDIERLLDAGDLNSAYQAATTLRERALAEGADAYPGAAYDISLAHFLIGRILKKCGQAKMALQTMIKTEHNFQILADAGSAGGSRMLSVAITEQADCLSNLGRLSEAADAYERAIDLDEQRGEFRNVAVGNAQLAMVRVLQGCHADALRRYEDARDIFDDLGEPTKVATSWHQIGMVYTQMNQFDAAERAYRQSLALEVQHNNRPGQASSMTELGNLNRRRGWVEQAEAFYRLSVDISVEIGDTAKEGLRRNNLADTLHKLGHNDEARQEILLAIECKQPFGYAVLPWTSFAILQNIEQTAGNETEATAAWRQARNAYLDYRRNGGYAQTKDGKICGQVLAGIKNDDLAPVRKLIDELRESGWTPAFIAALESIVAGDRGQEIGDDPQMTYNQSAELLLLLQQLVG